MSWKLAIREVAGFSHGRRGSRIEGDMAINVSKNGFDYCNNTDRIKIARA